MIQKLITLLTLFLIGSITCLAATKPILVFSAMKPEYQAFIHYLKNKKQYQCEGLEITQAKIKKHLVIASYSGVGSVNAAIASTLLIKKFHPSTLIVTGAAGGLQNNLSVGDVIVGTKIYSVNFGKMTTKGPIFPLIKVPANPFKNVSDPLIYQTSSGLQRLLRSMKTNIHLIFGSIATDQHFPENRVNDVLAKKYGSKIIDMEDVGFAHVCWIFNVPNFIAIRGVSDIIGSHIQYSNKTMEIAARNSGWVTYKLIQKMPELNKYFFTDDVVRN